MVNQRQIRLDSSANLNLVLDQWTQSLGQVLEAMTDRRPEVRWQAVSGPIAEVGAPGSPGTDDEVLWWEQPFHIDNGMTVWVGAPRATWEYAGTITLKAAGLEVVETTEARNTWFEILGQSLSAMGRSIGGVLGRETTCDAGVERAPDATATEWASVSIYLADAQLAPLLATFSPSLVEVIRSPQSHAAAEGVEIVRQEPVEARPAAPANSRTMELLLDVDLPVAISFGKAQLPLKDVLKLTTGSIVELNRGVSDQVEVLVNQCLIARGEVVVVEGNYGVRIQEIASRQDRLRSLR
jgi:flagellar motor switch protein FliN/FliY